MSFSNQLDAIRVIIYIWQYIIVEKQRELEGVEIMLSPNCLCVYKEHNIPTLIHFCSSYTLSPYQSFSGFPGLD